MVLIRRMIIMAGSLARPSGSTRRTTTGTLRRNGGLMMTLGGARRTPIGLTGPLRLGMMAMRRRRPTLVFMMTELEGKIAALKRLRVSSGWKRPTLLRQRPTRPWRKHAKRWQEFEQLVATSIQLAPKAILDISEVEKAREKDRPRGRAKDPEDLVRASSADNQDTAMPSALTGGPEKEGRRQLHHRLLRGVPSSARARARAPPRGRRARSSSPTTRRSGCPTSMSSA